MKLSLDAASVNRMSADGWFQLAEWCKESRLVSGYDRRFLFAMGRAVERELGLSERQVAHLSGLIQLLHRKLVAVGYDVRLGDSNDEPLIFRCCPNGHKSQSIRARFCGECGVRYPGLDPADLVQVSLSRQMKRELAEQDSRAVHAVCDSCQHAWHWHGVHRTLRQRCEECGRSPTRVTVFAEDGPVELSRNQVRAYLQERAK